MNKFKSGDRVRCVNDGGNAQIKTGSIYTVGRCTGMYTDLVGYGSSYYTHRFEPVDVNTPIGLPPEEVAKALLQGKALEYYHDGDWHKVSNPKTVAISFMQSGIFRYAIETMDYYGTEIPKPSTKPLDTPDSLYWVAIVTGKQIGRAHV